MPAELKYHPTKPLVYKFNRITQNTVADFVAFVENIRVIGGSARDCTSIMYGITTLKTYLGQ